MISFFCKHPKYLLLSITILLTACKENKQHLTKITANKISIDSTIAAKNSIKKLITPYKIELAKEMNKVYCYAPYKITNNDGKMQSSLGNLLADLCYQQSNSLYQKLTGNHIDFSMFNYGGIRAVISKGNVTKEQAFNLMPFENKLVVVTLSGKKIKELVQYFIKNKKAHPLSKQVHLEINGHEFSLSINGANFDVNKEYHVLTSDYLQGGGDNMNFFKNPVKLTKLNYKFRNAILDYFEQVDTLTSNIDNRVIVSL